MTEVEDSMLFHSQDPDIETLVRRIDRGTIDLQPDFQRGEVWSRGKKQRLIDSVLREWHIPPIHLVRRAGDLFDVLDGQQRLTAIREFTQNGFAIDGKIEPYDRRIASLHGLLWKDLDSATQTSFNNFTVRVFQLSDFKADEPYELFFRLNQPTNLTEAEKRNAFVGAPRNQIKELTAQAQNIGLGPTTIGFSNSRMAYDEALARFILTAESGSLAIKLTAQRITERYRGGEPFSHAALELALQSIVLTHESVTEALAMDAFKMNKATFHTWLCVAAEYITGGCSESAFPQMVHAIETSRRQEPAFPQTQAGILVKRLAQVFDDRATSRVLDVSSVLLRDFAAWGICYLLFGPATVPTSLRGRLAEALKMIDQRSDDFEQNLLEILSFVYWGDRSWM